MNEPNSTKLIRQYDVPTPRYTSYPTVPEWDTNIFSSAEWFKTVSRAFTESNDSKGISVYIHLPFCESLCTYCACNTRITKNHLRELPYIQSLLKEWDTYLKVFGRKPLLRELQLGGGTPTFFGAENLKWLVSYLLEDVNIHEDREFSFEGHPNNTSKDHLQALYDLGFDRVSFGVQDLDMKVQETINRVQPFENLEQACMTARSIGYSSINFDLIYGLPFQTPFTVSDTFDRILELHPDRLAFYSYAHVPWLRPGQRGYSEKDLPSSFLKRHLYDLGKHKLRNAGYADIGMDHFALRKDDLFKAYVAGKLHRNFMGYTTSQTDLVIGLGASSISDSGYAYAQNLKGVEEYTEAIKNHGVALGKGHILNDEDIDTRKCILQLSCTGKLDQELMDQVVDSVILDNLVRMEKEGLIYLFDQGGLRVTSVGEPFIRNICNVFDKRQRYTASNSQMFSKAI
ncbi:MAG: oxygen-independent coproporphyrinogen III oxidase [Chryseolinea sp.]